MIKISSSNQTTLTNNQDSANNHASAGNKLPLLIFDFDGTLIDSAEDLWVAMNKTLQHYNKPIVSREILVSHIGDGLKKLVHDFFPGPGIESKENLERVDEFLHHYHQSATVHTKLYPGVMDFLTNYKGPIALVTNKNIDPTRQLLKHFHLDQLSWVAVYGGDSLPEKKPSAMPLTIAMNLANRLPSETYMIGDGRPDMIAAEGAGCKKVAVQYGYSTPEELKQFNPDFFLSTFNDLSKIIC